MELVHENCFVVFKRRLPHQAANPEMMEEPLDACGTYAEAREILDRLHQNNQEGVIRFQGPTGGGD